MGCSNEGISLEGELEDYVEESKELRGQCETFFINNCNDLGRELEHIFPRELNSYALVETPGMTFPLFGLGGDKAYLFDPHIKWSAIISQDEARSYFGHVMLQLSDKPGEYDNLKALHFYYGE